MLASASATRRTLLAAAGLRFEAMASNVDEHAIRLDARARAASAAETALELARAKALAITRPGALVIGTDQILVCEGSWFDKPPDMRAARSHLHALRGRTHSLETAVVALRDGAELWRHLASPHLAMRPISDAFIDAYLAAEGTAVLGSVGAYRVEGRGIHLFDGIDGEHSAILGLPMLPLLRFLRSQDMVGA